MPNDSQKICQENIIEKKCSSCGKILPIDCFHKGKRYKDGYRGQCKQCRYSKQIEYNKAYYKRQYVIDKNRENSKKYYLNNKNKCLEYFEKYRKTHKEYFENRSKKFYAENIEYCKKYNKEYYIKNKEKIKKYKHNWWLKKTGKI